MADTKISNLDAVSTLGDTDEAVLAVSGASKKINGANLKASVTSVIGNAGTATKLATARAIDGQNFDGSAAITVIAPGTHAATTKATPVDADEMPLVDSAASNVLKKLTWANAKATLKAYFDTLYPSGSGTCSGTNTGDQTVPAFATNGVLLGSAAAAGAASTVMRSNDTIAAFNTTAATTQAFGDAAAVGTAAFASRQDHKHAMPADPITSAPFLAAIGGVAWTTVTKAGDTSRASTTTVAADPELTFTATSAAIYEFEAFIIYTNAVGGGTPDIKPAWGEDTFARGLVYGLEYSTADGVRFVGFQTRTNDGDAAGTATGNRVILSKGWHVGNGGAFSFWWAQATSDSNATTVKTGSVLRYRRII